MKSAIMDLLLIWCLYGVLTNSALATIVFYFWLAIALLMAVLLMAKLYTKQKLPKIRRITQRHYWAESGLIACTSIAVLYLSMSVSVMVMLCVTIHIASRFTARDQLITRTLR